MLSDVARNFDILWPNLEINNPSFVLWVRLNYYKLFALFTFSGGIYNSWFEKYETSIAPNKHEPSNIGKIYGAYGPTGGKI